MIAEAAARHARGSEPPPPLTAVCSRHTRNRRKLAQFGGSEL